MLRSAPPRSCGFVILSRQALFLLCGVILPARWFSWSFLLLSSFPAAALQRVQDRDRGHSHPPLCQQGSRLWCVNTSRISRTSRTSRLFRSLFYILFHSIWVYWVAVLEPERVVVHAVMAGSAVVIFSFTNPSGACAKTLSSHPNRPNNHIITSSKSSTSFH